MTEKIAISKDPKQQALRDLKKQWQNEMKVFIAQNIALKRGIGGVGDQRAGLPPSNIKDPLPREVSVYIDEMTTRFSNLVNIAKQIITNQEEYSRTRRKGRSEMQGVAFVDDTLTKEASNRLTRFWSKWTQMPWFREDKDIKARLRLMSVLADLQDQINDIEYILAGQDKKAITHAFFSFIRFLGSFRHGFIIKVNEQIQREFSEITGVPVSDLDKSLFAKVDPPLEFSQSYRDAKEKAQAAKNDAVMEDEQAQQIDQNTQNAVPPQGSVDTEAEANQLATSLSQVDDDIEILSALLAQINTLRQTSTNQLPIIEKDMLDSYMSLVKKIKQDSISIQHKIISNKNIDEFQQLNLESAQKVMSPYKQLLKAVGEEINVQANTFADMLTKVQALQAKALRNKPELKKIAKRKFERWIRRLTLALYSDYFSESKLDTVKKLRDLSIDLNAILNLLEAKDTKIAELFIFLADIYEKIANIGNDFVHFANQHNADYGQQRAGGGKPSVGPINRGDIQYVVQESKALMNDVAQIQGQSISGVKAPVSKDMK